MREGNTGEFKGRENPRYEGMRTSMREYEGEMRGQVRSGQVRLV